MRLFLVCFTLFFSTVTLSQEVVQEVAPQKVEQVSLEKVISKTGVNTDQETTPQVGKHVAGNMDAMSMILSLLMVLALIVVVAVVLKRFQPKQQGLAGLKIITSLHLGSKERLVIVQVAEKQLLLGVTAQQITLLGNLEEPLETGANLTSELGQSVISFFQKKR